MQDFILNHETSIRLGIFFGIFALMALLEIILPRRPLLVSKRLRWTNNLGIVVLNTLLVRVIFPGAASSQRGGRYSRR